jgi:hypothetical protein
MSRRTALAGLLVIVLLGGAAYGGYRVWRHFLAPAAQPVPKTALVVQAPPTAEPAAVATPSAAPTPLPASVFVKVPYSAQSPFNQWGGGNPHEEYCEAAAVLMVGQYFKGDTRATIPASEADSTMARMVSYERQSFPGTLDLPLFDVGSVGTQFYSLAPTVVPVDLDVIKRNLAEGRPVIVPVMTHGSAGQKIAPFYGATNVYHVIVLTGYDSARGLLYTNDAGFMQGQNYAYTWPTLSSAIDAQSTHLTQGRVMLIFKPSA